MTALWGGAAAFSLLMLGAVVGWHLWTVVPATAVLAFEIGLEGGASVRQWVEQVLRIPAGDRYMAGALLALLCIPVWKSIKTAR